MNEIEIYKSPDNTTEIEVVFDNDIVWLSQKQLSVLFQNTVPNINMHIKNIYKERELIQSSTIKKSLMVQKEGNSCGTGYFGSIRSSNLKDPEIEK
jgi:hypothetical protein